MDEFGSLSFDDSLFCGSNVKESRRLVSYNAKTCEEGWFKESVEHSQRNDVEKLDVLKFSADQLYYEKDYSGALVIYKNMLGRIPQSNATVRRDVEEAVARCHLNLGEAKPALDIALNMNKSVNPNNPDQQTVVWRLLRDVHKQMGNVQEHMRLQQDLVTLHPQNAHFWLELGDLYQKISVLQAKEKMKSESPLLSIVQTDAVLAGDRTERNDIEKTQSLAQSSEICDTESNPEQSRNFKTDTDREEESFSCENKLLDIQLEDGHAKAQRERCLACGCLIQARVLLQEAERSCTSFCRQKNEELQTKISSKLADMGVSEHVVTEATKLLEGRNEVVTNVEEKSPDDKLGNRKATFEDRWLSWVSCLQLE